MSLNTVVLSLPQDSEIYKVFKINLENNGFKVILLMSEEPFEYKDFKQHFTAVIRKTLLFDKNYKKELRKKYYTEKSLSLLENIEDKSVLSLIIRPDILDKELLHKVKKKSKRMVAYQWDGLDRFKDIFEYIPLFDDFYVFDKKDIAKNIQYNNLKASHNFYFDNIDLSKDQITHTKKAYFVGHFDFRITHIVKIGSLLEKLGLEVDIFLEKNSGIPKEYQEYSFLKAIKQPIPFYENLQKVYNLNILLDFHNPIHNGLSFRSFEALGYEKKLITNNELIKTYDFYHPNNIFVWNENNLEELEEFINKPYVKIEENIKEKYSFTYWFSDIMKI